MQINQGHFTKCMSLGRIEIPTLNDFFG